MRRLVTSVVTVALGLSLTQMSYGQRHSQVCGQALRDQISNDLNREVSVRIDNAQNYFISSREDGLRGRASVRVGQRDYEQVDFDCRVNSRSGYVDRVTWNRPNDDGWIRPPSSGSGRPSGGGWPGGGWPGNTGQGYGSDCRVPTLYSDDSLRGRQLTLDRSSRNLRDEGFGDDASSVCVPSGWRVVLYEDDSYRGDRLELSGPYTVRDLKRDRPSGQDWGDRISSVEVFRERPDNNVPSLCNQVPVLFDNDSFGGRQYRIDGDERDLGSRGFGDKASSICVPRGWVVEIFEDSDFRGDRLELRGPTSIADLKRERPDGRDWGDRVSSVRSSRRRR